MTEVCSPIELYRRQVDARYNFTESVVKQAELPSGLREAMLFWHENILDPKFYKQTGYSQLLPKDHYLQNIWSAASLLVDITDRADRENRSVWGVEAETIRNAFVKAAESESPHGMDFEQRVQTLVISENISYVINLHRDYKRLLKRDTKDLAQAS